MRICLTTTINQAVLLFSMFCVVLKAMENGQWKIKPRIERFNKKNYTQEEGGVKCVKRFWSSHTTHDNQKTHTANTHTNGSHAQNTINWRTINWHLGWKEPTGSLLLFLSKQLVSSTPHTIADNKVELKRKKHCRTSWAPNYNN